MPMLSPWPMSAFSHEERTISPETFPQASDQPRENVTPPTPRTHGASNDSFKSEDNLTEGVSFLANAYIQFANKPIQDCIKDGFPSSFLRCQNPQAKESSINADVSTSEPGRSYLQATDGLGPVSSSAGAHSVGCRLTHGTPATGSRRSVRWGSSGNNSGRRR